MIGIARQLPLGRGRDLMIHSTVPLGSGLSSSAALEVSTALALGWTGDLPSIELAKLSRRAENEFIGVPSGIMDQYASVFGQRERRTADRLPEPGERTGPPAARRGHRGRKFDGEARAGTIRLPPTSGGVCLGGASKCG